jgi:cytochrome c556
MSRTSLYAATTIAGLLGLCSFLYAQPESGDLIKYRKNTMEALGGHAGAISLIVRNKVDYASQLPDHAKALDMTMRTIVDIFPPDSAKGDTAAKAEIWQKPEEFKKAVAKAQDAASAFSKAVESGDKEQIAASFKELGESCKHCHDNFRKEEKK